MCASEQQIYSCTQNCGSGTPDQAAVCMSDSLPVGKHHDTINMLHECMVLTHMAGYDAGVLCDGVGVSVCVYRACLSESTGRVCLCLQGLSVCVYRACLSVSTGHVCLCLQGVSVCVYRACLSVSTELVCLCLQANGQCDSPTAPAV